MTQPARGSAETAPAATATEILTPEYRRYALLCLSFVNLWAALHYFMAGRTLRADLARAHIDRE